MRFRPLFLAVALLLAAPTAPAQAFFGPDESRLYSAHDGELAAIEAALAGGDARQVEMGLKEVLDRLEDELDDRELKLPLRAEFHARLLKLRADALRAGIPLTVWRRWAPIDGFPEAKQDALVGEVDDLVYNGLASELKEAKALQARLKASSEPMHAFVNRHVLEPAIAGAGAQVVRDQSEFAIDRLTRILMSEPMPHGDSLQDELARVKKAIQAMRALGVDPAKITLKAGERRLGLLQALKEAEPIVAASVKRREAAAAAAQARLVLYRKGLKGDRARLFDREGMPEWWSADKDTPETMATARLWRYRVTEGNAYFFVYFQFDTHDRMVKRTVERQ